MLLSYIFGPSVVKYGILSNNRRSELHAVIDCQFFILKGDTHDWKLISLPLSLKFPRVICLRCLQCLSLFEEVHIPVAHVMSSMMGLDYASTRGDRTLKLNSEDLC